MIKSGQLRQWRGVVSWQPRGKMFLVLHEGVTVMGPVWWILIAGQRKPTWMGAPEIERASTLVTDGVTP